VRKLSPSKKGERERERQRGKGEKQREKAKTKGWTCLKLAWENRGFSYRPYPTLFTFSFLSEVFFLGGHASCRLEATTRDLYACK
jgi:hypothetical protein